MCAIIDYSDQLDIGISACMGWDEIITPVNNLRHLSLLVIVISLILAFLLISFSATSITKPIIKLTIMAENISKGNLDQTIDISSKDEIGILSKAFNTMASNLKKDINKLKQTEKELKRHRDHLEELVQERTKELVEKNKELEEFNDLFVNREFRIKELKDKVKELEGKNGKQA